MTPILHLKIAQRHLDQQVAVWRDARSDQEGVHGALAVAIDRGHLDKFPFHVPGQEGSVGHAFPAISIAQVFGGAETGH